MSELEVEAVAAKKGPPSWMVPIGCGCLVPGFLIVATGAYLLQMAGNLVNQDSAWKSLGEIVEYDDVARGTPTGEEDVPKTPLDESRSPGEFELLLGGDIPNSGGLEAYWFGRDMPNQVREITEFGEDPLSVSIVKMPTDQSDKATQATADTPLHEDTSFVVNGKTLRARRIPEMVSDDLFLRIQGLEEIRGAGAAVWIREGYSDPDSDGDLFDVVVFFQRPNSAEPITQGDVQSFLGPFHLEFDEEATDAEPAAPPEEDGGK